MAFRNAGLKLFMAAALALAWVPHAAAQISFVGASSSSAITPQFRAATSATLSVPTFRAANSASVTTATSLTITKPAGTAANDVMIASIGIRPTTSTITPPAGWTLIRRLDNANANANSLAIYYKVATAAEGANYTFTVGGQTHATGGIQGFSGVDISTPPYDAEDGQNTASSTSHATPTITTTVANAMVVATFSFASGSTFTPPGTFTESFDVNAGGINAVGQTTEGDRKTQATRATIGPFTATAANDADVGNTDILTLNPVLRINAPAGLVQNDVMIASVALQPSTATVSAPAGWTLVRRVDNGTATTNSLLIYQKVAGAAEPTFYDWSVSGTDFAVGGIQAFFGVDTTTPIDVENGQATASSLNQATPSVTTSGANEMIVTSHTIASSTTFTPPTGMTESFDVANGAAAAAGQTIEGNRVFQAAAGATGAKSATAAANADRGNTDILALQPTNAVLTIAVPAGTLAGHVMVASIAFSPSVGTAPVTAPAGWTLQTEQDNANATTNSLYVYTRVASAAEPASYTWTTTAATFAAAGGIMTFQGVDNTTPVNVKTANNTNNNTNSTTITANGVTTTVANTMVVSSHAYASSGTFTPPAGMAEAFEAAALIADNASGEAIEGNYVAQAATGGTGNKSATASGNSDRGNAAIVVLQTAAAPNGAAAFNAFETATTPNPGATTGKIFTKLVGTAFSLDVIALSGGAQYTGFTNTVAIDLVTGTTPGTNNCPTVGLTSVASVSPNPTIVAGRSTVSFPAVTTAYRDVRVRIRFPAAAPTITACSNDDFAIRPTGFTVSSTNATQNGSSGTPIIKTGASFNLTATSVAGYDGTPSINNSAVVGSTVAGAIGGSFGAAPAATGTATGASFTYSEVGNFGLNANAVFDSTFTSVDQASDCVSGSFSNVLAGGQYGCSFGSAAIAQTTGTSGFGRFIPDHFTLVAGSTLTNRSAAACSPASTFTYMNEGFAVAFTLQAQNSSNTVTQNYAGAYAKLSPATFSQLGVGAVSGATPLTSRVDPASISAGSFTAGQAAITATVDLTRAASPDGPFTATKIAIAPIDSDNVQLSTAALDTDVDGVGGNDHQQIGSSTEFRFGIMKLGNAVGSQSLDLPMPLQTQYWTGTGFSVNAQDSCTAISLANVSFPTYYPSLTSGNMPSGNVTGNPVGTAGKFAAGVGNLVVKKPTASVTGAVDVQISLTAEAKTYLQLKRSGTTFTQDPLGRAAFGLYGSQPANFIYLRENY